ncbi:MAG: NAD(P)/FAD-dependent oxidoreductase [Clostridiales Family XIII bacterium]|jgi:2,4-dienoyl-CoA reductase-like NADH-dependent reductase (Old Yellow Enzyme family)/NADPH-dependent 2,4-dienoyl-CoA reductase/sulfur reductase-like enzyme|nr:NAD(P)/FAD-dependent oxidoreductase [Clostridiales Family XIII bacterium]
MEMKYPRIFEPIKLGDVYFRNRLWASPTGHHEMTPDCFPDPEVVGYYEAKAKGGVASVSVGDCIVHSRTGQSHVKQIHLDDPLVVPQLTAVAAAISRHGCVAAAELSHGGKYSHVPELLGGEIESPPFLRDGSGITYGPVAGASPSGHPILEMPEGVILEIIEAFGRGAAVARLCGFTMATVHGGHGWLLAQFMSENDNKRKDRWGGSFENRMRMPLAVIDSIRRHVGKDFPIEFRMSGDECFDGGYHIDYGVKIAKALDGKVDLIHVSTGNHEAENGFVITHPNIFMEEGANVKFAAEIKKRVQTPVATVGALSDPAQMEEIIASGKADVVQFARQLLVDPDFVNKVRDGSEDDAHRCLRCETCFSNAFSNRYHRCAINPRLGVYVDDKFAIPAAKPKRVLVVGGGVAGMQAALTAADRGHDVILCEKTGRLGGVLNGERNIPFKFRVAEYLDRQARKVARAKIDVRLDTCATPELAKALRPDAILVCAGAAPVVPRIKGIKGANVLSAEQAALNPELVGKRAVVIGAGFVGLETAIWLAMLGRKATVVEMRGKAENGNTVHHVAVSVQLEKYKIPVELSTKAVEITAEGLSAKGPDGKARLYKADTVIYAAGQRPLWDVADALKDAAPWVNVIGDARSPRVIADATREAYFAARDIGAF